MDGQVSRRSLLAGLVELIDFRRSGRVLRVAIDGPDTAGKTTLAGELADNLAARCEVIRAGIDEYHHAQKVRYQRGRLSPEGVYHDSFDYNAVRTALLDPLGPDGNRWYRTAVFDYRTDTPVEQPPRLAPAEAVLLVDGVYLLRPQLRAYWDFSIFLHVSPTEVLDRAVVRDSELMGGPDAVRERYLHRYLPAQQLYRADAAPELIADVIIDNDDPAAPRVVKWPR